MSVLVSVSMSVFVFVSMSVSVSISMCVFVCVFVCVCVYVCHLQMLSDDMKEERVRLSRLIRRGRLDFLGA